MSLSTSFATGSGKTVAISEKLILLAKRLYDEDGEVIKKFKSDVDLLNIKEEKKDEFDLEKEIQLSALLSLMKKDLVKNFQLQKKQVNTDLNLIVMFLILSYSINNLYIFIFS